MADSSLVDFSLMAARACVFLSLMLAAGLPLYLLSAGRGVAVTRQIRAVVVMLAVVSAATSAWWALASIAAMASQPVTTLDSATVSAVLDATPLGMVLNIRLGALLALAITATAPLGRWRLSLAALSGSVALATCAFTGHAGATEGSIGSLHRLADVIHLFAAATWLAALTVLIVTAFSRAEPHAFEAWLTGFAKTGTVVVAALVLTGAINTLAILGWPLPPAFYSSLWAKILALKLALFAGMLALAALNRWRLTPALADGTPGASQRLRRSLMLETLFALMVLALVSALGMLDPSGSAS